jgi:hypothetical protein
MRLYRLNDRSGPKCSHMGEVEPHIAAMIYSKSNVDLLTIIERLQKVVDELERRVYGAANYRTPG